MDTSCPARPKQLSEKPMFKHFQVQYLCFPISFEKTSRKNKNKQGLLFVKPTNVTNPKFFTLVKPLWFATVDQPPLPLKAPRRSCCSSSAALEGGRILRPMTIGGEGLGAWTIYSWKCWDMLLLNLQIVVLQLMIHCLVWYWVDYGAEVFNESASLYIFIQLVVYTQSLNTTCIVECTWNTSGHICFPIFPDFPDFLVVFRTFLFAWKWYCWWFRNPARKPAGMYKALWW